jgi:pimeloyl-ACP methyl ester carboxylesterase
MSLAGLALALWTQSCGAADIRVHCQGQGPSLYLIGGGPAFTTWNLEPVQRRLSTHHRACRWDMRGIGDNAGLKLQPGVPALSQWLRDMEEVLPPEPVVLWGHSWGALQALLFARDHPHRVGRLILSNPVDPGLRSLASIERKRFNHPDPDGGLRLEDMGTPAETLHNLRSKVASYFVDPARGWAYASGFGTRDSNPRLNVRIWEEYRKSPLGDADLRVLADRIAGLIYCRDDVLQPEALQEYRRLLAAGRHLILNGCAHFPWEENPDDYFAALSELLGPRQSVPSRPGPPADAPE